MTSGVARILFWRTKRLKEEKRKRDVRKQMENKRTYTKRTGEPHVAKEHVVLIPCLSRLGAGG